MSSRKYLSELSGERLYGLFTDSTNNEAERAAASGTRPSTHLFGDLRQCYPGIVEALERVWDEIEDTGYDKMYLNGVKAGSLLMLHMLRLAAEHDEIADAIAPQDG